MDTELDADIEIDPDLFIKCRLCIEENGSFRIHQSLQDQIKFCFDITVQDFDYLSKLLCKKCRTILGEFVAVKKKFIANQTILLDKLKSRENQRGCNDTNTGSSIEQVNKEKAEKAAIDKIRGAQEIKKRKTRINKRVSLFNPSSSEDEEFSSRSASRRSKRKISSSSESSCEREVEPVAQETIKVDEPKQLLTWDQSYQKYYVCRFCDYKNYTEEGIIMHGKIHSKLMQSCVVSLQKHCTIEMEKIDDRPNVTGDLGNVVLSHDKIVSGVHNICYYVKYILPEQSYETKRVSTLKRIVYDSSEDDTVRKYRNTKNKKIRLQSRSSSNETVVLEGSRSRSQTSDKDRNTNDKVKKGNKKSDSLDIECIDIVDTSSNDSNDQVKPNHKTKDNELKIIHDVTADCFKKYLASCVNIPQNESGNKNLDEMLHRKLLSVGRKLMPTNVSRGLPTPGLLKYLQYKNVNINWIPACKQNFCRIITEIAPQKSNTNLKGWYAVKGNIDFEVREKNSEDHLLDQVQEKQNDLDKIVENNEQEINISEQVTNNEAETVIKDTSTEIYSTPVIPVAEPFVVPAVLHQIIDTDIEQGNKLLNANPVANPKQLPKKNTFMPHYEMKKTVDTNNPPKAAESVKDSLLLVDQNQPPELSMPIITSTTSLAQEPVKQNGMGISNKPEALPSERNEMSKNTPRIKCKPVSELMPQSRSILKTPQHVQKVASVSQLPHLVSIISKTAPKPAQDVFFTPTDKGQITMNSVDLPNSSSISPIEYFKTVLKMHGLELISQVNYKLTHDFISLVKFKLECSLLERTVVICLSLFAHESTFCLKLRNSAEEMDLDLLPAHWQMKILQAYRGEVSQKILQFSKTLNERLHNNAKQFVLLLENIEFKVSPGLGD